MTLPTKQDPKQDPKAPEPEKAVDGGEAQNQPVPEGDGTEDVVFDKERALETIRAQRESERKLAKQLKEAQTRLKQFDDQEAVKKQAEMTELEKAQARADELEKALQESRETTQALLLQQTFFTTTRTLKLNFASPQAEADAFELADLEDVEIGEDGKITGLEDAIKKLQASRPYLFASGDQGDAGGDKQGTPKRSGKPLNGKLNPDATKTPVKLRF